jgi:hypothetical protein
MRADCGRLGGETLVSWVTIATLSERRGHPHEEGVVWSREQGGALGPSHASCEEWLRRRVRLNF